MKRIITRIFVAMFFAMIMTSQTFAVPAYPYPVKFKQSDGTVVTVTMKGDEKVRWAETLDGFTVMYNAKGDLEYSVLDNRGDMVPSGILAKDAENRNASEQLFLSNVAKQITYSPDQVAIIKQIWNIQESEKGAKVFPTTGNRKLVCILIGFKDKAFTKTQADFNNLFNQVGYNAGGATGSVKDYYLENSWNQFNLTVDVFGPYTASQNMSYYGANDSYGNDVRPRELVTEAINLADPQANYANYDNDGDGSVDGVYVIYAGYGEEAGGGANCIWAHAWNITTITRDGKTLSKYSCSAELTGNSGTTITGIGVICHEFGHVLGAPDYYDTNYSTGGQYDGTGNWDMMAAGSWNNNGKTPAHHNAFTKIYIYNWATATTLSTAQTVTVYNAAENKSFYRINTTTSGEYYLIENRQKHKFDAYIPGSGLLIYHVHSGVMSAASSNNINATHPQKMYPVAQNATVATPTSTASSYGSINSSTCAWTGASGTKNQFTDATTPSMKSWAGANTNAPITNITQNTTAKTVTFAFMGGSSAPTLATVTTSSASSITANSAVVGGNVTADGGATVTERGIVYATTQNPTTSNSKVASGSGTGSYSVTLSGLAANTTYYARAYAINSAGTAYGAQISFTTTSSGGTSTTVSIGTGTSKQGFPLNCYYGYERSAALYTAAEIGKVGSITKLGWYPTVTQSYNVPVKIYLKQTTATTISSSTWATMISGATLVYSGTMAGITANTWKEFTLSTAFNYTGGSNNLLVLVETNYGGTGAGTSTGPAIYYTSSTSRHMYLRADNSAPTGKGTVNSYRPNLRLTITTFSGAPVANHDDEVVLGELVEAINAYPNPTTGILTVKSSVKPQSIEVYNITGSKVLSISNLHDAGDYQIDMSNYQTGVYLVVVYDGETYHKVKVIKQ
ncbi:MAG TPA: M6 family metalloprotease domain-containing protein [Salinivirgaceae bacterium]|nr:M6 family metalloprotease domain-containing protein [Salinivirgaceae bacterium]